MYMAFCEMRSTEESIIAPASEGKAGAAPLVSRTRTGIARPVMPIPSVAFVIQETRTRPAKRSCKVSTRDHRIRLFWNGQFQSAFQDTEVGQLRLATWVFV